jgi:septum formation protein
VSGTGGRELLLASTSRYRRALLGRLGLPFRCVAPGVDEAAAVAAAGAAGPEAIAGQLARAKAAAVAAREPMALVIGSDQVCALGDEVFGKPGTREGACAQLARLGGREHRLLTAVAVLGPGVDVGFVDLTRLRMRALGAAEIERYVDADEPFDCAGSYKLEGLGIALFDRVESADWTAVEGLPLLRLAGVLRELGWTVP